MIIVLEGADGAGKSTLALQLAQLFNLEIHHEGPPPTDISPLDHYGGLIEVTRQLGRNVVFDRLALGECVYGPIYRNNDRLGPAGLRLVNRLLDSVAALRIMCLPPYEVCRTNWAARAEVGKEMITKLETHRQVYHRFDELMDGYYHYDYTEDRAFERLESLVDAWKKHVAVSALPFGVIGSPGAKLLLVGAKGSNSSAHVDLPFWATIGSSRYLYECLDEAGIGDNEVAFVNAYRHDKKPQPIPRLERVVALGQLASSALVKADISHVMVPHPQYWKRFYYSDRTGYAEKLKIIRNEVYSDASSARR